MPTGLLASAQPGATELSYIQPQLQSSAYVPYQAAANRTLTQTLTQAAAAQQRNNAAAAHQFAVAAAAARPADPFQQSLCMSASLVLPRHSLQGKQVGAHLGPARPHYDVGSMPTLVGGELLLLQNITTQLSLAYYSKNSVLYVARITLLLSWFTSCPPYILYNKI